MAGTGESRAAFLLPKDRVNDLIDLLWARGFRVVGPVVRNGAVVIDEVRAVQDLPVGRRDDQEAGVYRLQEAGGDLLFGVVNGPGSLKGIFYLPREPLIEMRRERGGFAVREVAEETQPVAALGVRPCDLAALEIQDRVFIGGRFRDTHYERRRQGLLSIVVNCTRAAPTCFCSSMGTGPAAPAGCDLALTELDGRLLVDVGSAAGEELVGTLALEVAPPADVAAARSEVDACATSMARAVDRSDLPGLLFDEVESPQWDDVARRCLSCGNCTMVCPTCFCHAVVEVPALDNASSQRVRQWDSCFSYEFAHIAGKNFRPRIRDRYRQWLTHKLASWIDQFGTSGCVGCGRCISWCPVGIDLTAEVAAIRARRGGTPS
ncbi:4Fe-4S dicluster domain-containing protein [Candidatus Binatia bacterium]|nr:4Fe-4S dicluster domain-containing protein [Candidatus Binatia bacterium]